MNNELNKSILTARQTGAFINPDGTLTENFGREGRQNSNTVLIGGSGTGKTFGNLAQTVFSGGGGGSMVISDPKGTLHELCAATLEEENYDVMLYDTVDFRGIHYNLIDSAKTPNDYQKAAHIVVYNGINRDNVNDNIQLEAEQLLLECCIGYLKEGGKGFTANIEGLTKLIGMFKPEAFEKGETGNAERIFNRHKELYEKRTGKSSWACEQFNKLIKIPGYLLSTAIVRAALALQCFDTDEMREMSSYSDIDLKSIADRKTALFIKVSDTDRSKDPAVNIFYTQLMDTLCRYADSLEDKHLPVPVRFILDDFGTNVKIQGFENMISNIRSRGISVQFALQTLSQLEQGYGAGSNTILANCATKIYMGGCDYNTARYFSLLANKPVEKILSMPMLRHLYVRQGGIARFADTLLLDSYDLGAHSPESKTRKSVNHNIEK